MAKNSRILLVALLLLTQGLINPLHSSAAPVKVRENIVINYKTGSSVMAASEMKKLFSLSSRIESSLGKNVVITRFAYYKRGITALKLKRLASARLMNIQETALEIPITAKFLGSAPIIYSENSTTKNNRVILLVTWDLPTPTINSISLNRGPASGGTTVNVSGTNFYGVTGVSIGGVDSKSFRVDSPNLLSFVTPPSTAGSKDLVIKTKGGDVSLLSAFIYEVASLASVTPGSGFISGGTSVQIRGLGLSSATNVNFGAKPAQSFTVNSDSLITAISPSGPVGNTQITVVTASGSPSIAFTYIANLPTITSLSKTSGGTAGGNTVVINGANLLNASSVTFGGIRATSYVVNSDSQISAIIPARLKGPAAVVVTTPAGNSISNIEYTFLSSVSINPALGPIAGGSTVTITGSNLTGTTAVTFNGVNATSFSVVSSTIVTAVIPAQAAGSIDVRVTTPSETFLASFSYVASPVIQSISPTTGPLVGGTNVVISGFNFIGVSSVKFGNLNATFVVNNNNTITALSPAGVSSGAVQIQVQSSIAPAAVISYSYLAVAAPTITLINPSSGPASGGNTIIVTGTNFLNTSSVTFGGTPATSFTVLSSSQLSVLVPAKSAGLTALTVNTPGGITSGSYAFTASAVPSAPSLSPISGSTSGGETVTITGVNLTGATGVTFGGTSATSITVLNSTTLRVVTPSKVAGPVVVVVTTPGGSATVGTPYSFIASAPTLTSLTPGFGSTAGGNSVTITGTNLIGTTSVRFGANSAVVTSNSATSLTVTVPSGVSAPVSITVVTAGGSITDLSYNYLAPPTITSFTPASGPIAGGTSVTITGTGFTGTSLVTLGGTAAAIVGVSDTSITITTPSRVAGAVTIRVVNSVGSANSPTQFTYE